MKPTLKAETMAGASLSRQNVPSGKPQSASSVIIPKYQGFNFNTPHHTIPNFGKLSPIAPDQVNPASIDTPVYLFQSVGGSLSRRAAGLTVPIPKGPPRHDAKFFGELSYSADGNNQTMTYSYGLGSSAPQPGEHSWLFVVNSPPAGNDLSGLGLTLPEGWLAMFEPVSKMLGVIYAPEPKP